MTESKCDSWVGKESHFQSHGTATPEPDPVLRDTVKGNWPRTHGCISAWDALRGKGLNQNQNGAPFQHLTTTVFHGEPNMCVCSVLCSFSDWARKSSSSEIWHYSEFYLWRRDDDNLGSQLSWVTSSPAPNRCPRIASIMAADQDVGKMAARYYS